jgi:hypothetical protein
MLYSTTKHDDLATLALLKLLELFRADLKPISPQLRLIKHVTVLLKMSNSIRVHARVIAPLLQVAMDQNNAQSARRCRST